MKRKLMILTLLCLLVVALAVSVSAKETNEMIPLQQLLNAVEVSAAGQEHPYVEVVTKAINESNLPGYTGLNHGYGALCDVDENGVTELLLVHIAKVPSPYGGGKTEAMTYSVYTVSDYKAVPLVETEALFYMAGGPSGSLEVVEKNGKRYIAAHANNPEGLEYEQGTWTLYNVQGAAITVDTKVEYVKECYYNTGNINYNKSYVNINGTKYGYSQLKTWENSYTKRLIIEAMPMYGQTDPNIYKLAQLQNKVQQLPFEGRNGLHSVDGVWGYYEGGVLQTDYTGLVPYGDILFYVENGILDFSYTGLVWHEDAWRYVANSELTEGYTGLVWFNDNWFYTVDSVIDWTFTGLVPYEGNYFYVQNNLLDWSYTGLGYHDGGWYFIQNGLLQKEYSGLVYFNDNWFYVEEGVLTYQYFGMVEYEGNLFYVQASHLDWNYTGLGYHEGNWYYFQNALYMPDYNGMVDFNGGIFYLEGGVIDWSVNGLREHEGDLYYFVNSAFDATFNGTAEYDGVTYEVVNGVVDL